MVLGLLDLQTFWQFYLIRLIIASAFNRSGTTQVVVRDIFKASDRLWHAGLLHKLKSYGIEAQVFGLISSFLRMALDDLDGKSSKEYPVNAGVPQGSILGPTLSLLPMNYLPDVICNQASDLCWSWLPLLNWIGDLTLSLLLIPLPRKLEPWFIYEILFTWSCSVCPWIYHMAMHGIMLSCLGWWHVSVQKWICRIAGPSLAASLEPLAYHWNVASTSLFYRHYFSRCSSELAELVLIPY